MKGRVLIAGFATRHVAQSAYRAGYEVCAVDHFCDQDLAWCTQDRIRFEHLDDLPDALDRMCRRHRFDMLVVTSGAEELPSCIPLCGTPREKVTRFLDKCDTQHFFETIRVPAPGLRAEGEFPAMVKPRRGAGGWRNAIVTDTQGLQAWETLYPGVPYIRQEPVEGIPASVCCVTNGCSAHAIAANEQVLRGNGDTAFGFCGSVTPLDHPLRRRMMVVAEQIAAASGCTGTIGVDFVLGTSQPYVIEVNPRFQGTVDTVEMAYGCNLFQLHVNACAGLLPSFPLKKKQVAVRSILFTDRDMMIEADLKSCKNFLADIPYPGTSFDAGQAVVSVFGWGESRNAALLLLDKHISSVTQYIR